LTPTNTFEGSVTVFLHTIDNIDLRNAVSRTGIISETLRLRKEALRSIHPSHPVAAVGKRAKELLAGHNSGDSPAGVESPYGKVTQLDNGKILLMGVTNRNNTCFHTAEEYYTPYIFIGETFVKSVTALDGSVYDVKVKGYCTGIRRNFTVLDGKMYDTGTMKSCKIGNAVISLIKAKDLLNLLRLELSKDPYILLEK